MESNTTTTTTTTTTTHPRQRRTNIEVNEGHNDKILIPTATNDAADDKEEIKRRNNTRRCWNKQGRRCTVLLLLFIVCITGLAGIVIVTVCLFFRIPVPPSSEEMLFTVSSSSSSSSIIGSNENVVCNANDNGYESLFPRSNSNSNSNNNNTPHTRRRSNGDTTNRRPVFLWGIPSTSSEYEIGRRKLLRETYLNYYHTVHAELVHTQQHQQQKTNDSRSPPVHIPNPSRICSLHEWMCNSNNNIRQSCEMIYVFFIGGGNKVTAPPILLNESITDFRDMLVPTSVLVSAQTQPQRYDLHEPGVIYLNIRENQFDGKMTTWYKFGSVFAQEFNTINTNTNIHISHRDESSSTAAATATTTTTPTVIDYIFKVDSDLLLFTPNFFDWFEHEHTKRREQQQQQQQQQHPTTTATPQIPSAASIYGGIEFPATNCVVNYTFDHPCPLPLRGRSYMSGELNFMTPTLATYIASQHCPRQQWTIPHEDVSLSNYVYSYEDYAHNDSHNHNKYYNSNNKSTSTTTATTSIDIISVNPSQILLLPNMKSDWYPYNMKQTPELLTGYYGNGTKLSSGVSGSAQNQLLLWAHSIKRGNYTMYLYWKKDTKFRTYWQRYYKLYVYANYHTLVPLAGGSARSRNTAKQNPATLSLLAKAKATPTTTIRNQPK